MINIIFKAVEKCNSNCVYCEVIAKHENEIMKYELLQEVLQKVNDYLLKNQNEEINLTWHGGEVCLLGADYFYKTIELLEKYCKTTKNRIKHSVQSNLTLINQEIIDAFKILGIKNIGSSYEFIPHIRGFGKQRDAIAYNRKFFEGVSLLEKNGLRWGVIYVVHKQSLEKPLEVFHILTNLNVSSGPKFNKIYIYGEDKYNLAITGKEYADFLGAIFPFWWKNRERFPKIAPFSNFYDSYTYKVTQMDCELTGLCSHRWMYIGPTGNVSQCGRGGDFEILNYGKIQYQTFEDILTHPLRKELKNRTAILRNTTCKDCRFWMVCHGGCPIDAMLTNGKITTKAPHCDWVKPFLTEYFEPITGLVTND
ncbi:MAG: radical SAM protein [Lentimicrobiaceae bacterium]|nr:radical SAM protein [Lentimicrobiaceae bacterium]